jgi:hypothetical protein
MSRKNALARCAACGSTDALGVSTCRVVVDGRAVCLCREHAAMVAAALPRTFEDLRAVFRGIASPLHGDATPPDGIERRSPIARRDRLDRREFPPRPEGRRVRAGRRATDRAA